MLKSNIQVGKFYKEKSKVMDAFRYIHVSKVTPHSIEGDIITMYDEFVPNNSYIDTGNWIEVDQQEFEQRKELATSNTK